MRERIAVRVLLFDPDGRILMMKGRLPSAPDAPGAWFTVGGGIEPGETLEKAAVREVWEEAGLRLTELGPVVWRRESVIAMADHDLLLKESYVVARCDGGEPVVDGWDEVERVLCDEVRWWRPQDLPSAAEAVFPPGLADLLPDILAGRYPAEPLTID